jgi:hypothetical protein
MSQNTSGTGSFVVLRKSAGPLLIAFSSTFLAVLCTTVQARSQGMSDCTQLGQTSRMIVGTSEDTAKDKPLKDRRDEGQLINSLREMFAALRVCWVPPPPEKSRPGMEYTIIFAFKRDGELIAPARVTYSTHGVPEEVRNVYHEAIEAAFRRCTPMHFSTSMAGAIAGRPLVFHIFDDRIMAEHFKNGDQGTKKEDPYLAPAQDGQLK